MYYVVSARLPRDAALIVRQPDRMLPLQPRTRLLFAEALHEHLQRLFGLTTLIIINLLIDNNTI